MSDKIVVYTDGSCFLNKAKKPGGWAFVVPNELEVSGGARGTTNNRMELTAAIECLSYLQSEGKRVELYSDSTYVINGITKFIHNWRRKDWKDVKNPDLWKQLDALNQNSKVSWNWVKAHDNNFWNDRADLLAKSEATKFS